MELVRDSAIGSWFSPAARRKRSDSRRRPHPNPKPVNHFQNAFTLDNGRQQDTNLYSSPVLEPERPGKERKLKKLKLKLGGVTRTLHSKSSTYDAGVTPKMQRQASSMEINYKNTFVLKSNQITKKHAFDDGFDEDDEEIRYLKKLKTSKVTSRYGDGQDDDLKSNKDTKDFADVPGSGQEMTMTTRKRALGCPEYGGLLEFPNGLPDAPSKKQKLTEVEHQSRKAEVAQRRKLQADRAEAEAIRKILGQDSGRKKKEEKQKTQDDIAQLMNSAEKQTLTVVHVREKTEMATTLRPNTVRLSMGPNGTIVTFSDDLGFPKIFNSLPCRYPSPREKCVGPNCTNEYKYRDSKSKLPLCSLHCYKSVQGN